MKIATWNVNGIRARTAQLCEWVARDQPDIICLQELKAEPAQIPPDCHFADYHSYWHCLKAYSGVSLQIRRDLVPGVPRFSHPDFDIEARIVQAELDDLVIASVYVPNGGKDFPAKLQFIEAMTAWARQIRSEGRQLIICGDLNIARLEIDVHPKERKPNSIGQLPEERALFETLLGGELTDMGRAFDPENPGLFTWWAPWRDMRARNIGWRIDYVLATEGIADRAAGCVVLPEVGTSDHAPVVLTIA